MAASNAETNMFSGGGTLNGNSARRGDEWPRSPLRDASRGLGRFGGPDGIPPSVPPD